MKNKKHFAKIFTLNLRLLIYFLNRLKPFKRKVKEKVANFDITYLFSRKNSWDNKSSLKRYQVIKTKNRSLEKQKNVEMYDDLTLFTKYIFL